MARLDYVNFQLFDASLNEGGELVWEEQPAQSVDGLPQIYWSDGSGWYEANVWAVERSASGDVKLPTTKSGMKHLNGYANFLETRGKDWRHFPVRKEQQVLRLFRKYLIDEVSAGNLAHSTATNRMNTVIQFYRFADSNNLVGSHPPMWTDRLTVIPYHDSAGFKRRMVRLTNDLKIPNRKRVGARLEEGLLPLRSEHMSDLLRYVAAHESEELRLMLSTGFFTGARIGTITSLTVSSLYTSREDPQTPGIYLLPVGPGTGVATKFSVSGDLIVPKAVLDDLKAYSSSTLRLLREAKANRANKDRLFLTRRAIPYTVETVNRLNQDMRARAVNAGLSFVLNFKFHQSRATFGTWLMKILLDCNVKTSVAIGIVKDAMLHKDESTTFSYIKFIENTQAKEQASTAFSEAFTGLRGRDWDKEDV